ncbi:aquaporin-like protein [Ascodesmis nigricans]|uniref:Aquaporin-like protein n=1 Tax=Ascodesmis nigricans TaxID=341454 RepID=A0A4V3SI01_9PEZI|nr:aquaporin-like protein [Ascodesmis nigricans]
MSTTGSQDELPISRPNTTSNPQRPTKPWIGTVTMIRNFSVDWLGEYIGTTMFLFFAFSGTLFVRLYPPDSESSTTSPLLTTLYIALIFGFSLAINVWIFFRVSGGFFNPAITFAFFLAGKLPLSKTVIHLVAQILGGMTAAGLVKGLFPGGRKTLALVGTELADGMTVGRGLAVEMFLTAELVFTVFMLAAEKHRATFLAPIGIGLAMFVIELSGAFFTGGSANPTRSFGPCVASHSFPGFHWIYWVGPGLGSILATLVYKIVKCLEYEDVNPGQDANLEEKFCVNCRQKLGSGN